MVWDEEAAEASQEWMKSKEGGWVDPDKEVEGIDRSWGGMVIEGR